MTNFNVGDKVRILDVDAIYMGDSMWRNGDITEVVGFTNEGEPQLAKTMPKFDRDDWLYIGDSETHAIEIVERFKPTKKKRIEALESQVEKQAEQIAELQSTIEKLREALA